MAQRHDDTPPTPTGNPSVIAEWWAKLPADVFYAVRCGLDVDESGETRHISAGHLMAAYWTLALAVDVWTHETTREIQWIADQACISYRSARRALDALDGVGLIRRERLVGEDGKRFEYAYHLVGPWDNDSQRPGGDTGPVSQARATPPVSQAGATPSRETQRKTHRNGQPDREKSAEQQKDREVTPLTKADSLVGASPQVARRSLRGQKSRPQSSGGGTVIPPKPKRETGGDIARRLIREGKI